VKRTLQPRFGPCAIDSGHLAELPDQSNRSGAPTAWIADLLRHFDAFDIFILSFPWLDT
jgi:hypothetical protein